MTRTTRFPSSLGPGAASRAITPSPSGSRTLWSDRLRPFVEEEETLQAQQGGQVSNDMRRRLRQAAKDLGAKMAEVMKRLEVEFNPEGSDDGSAQAVPSKLRVVPPRTYLAPEAQQTFSIHSWPEAWADDEPPPESWTATIYIADEGVASLSATEVALMPDPRDPRRKRGVFQVTAGTTEDATLVEVRLGGASEVVELEIAAEDATVPSPTRLMFSQTSYHVRLNQEAAPGTVRGFRD